MKRLVLLTLLAATTLFTASCKSPKGNFNRLQMGTSRPSPLQ